MAYFSVMFFKTVLLFLLMMGVLIDLRDCKPYQSNQSSTTKSTYYSGSSNQPTTKKPIARTIPPKTNPSTGPVSPSDPEYLSFIGAPRNCPDGYDYNHNNECVAQFFGFKDPNEFKNKTQQLSSTSTTSRTGVRTQNTNQNTVNTKRY